MAKSNIDKAQISIGGITFNNVDINPAMEICDENDEGSINVHEIVIPEISCRYEAGDLICTDQKADKLTITQYPRKLKSKKRRIRRKWNKKYGKTHWAVLTSFTPNEGVEYDGMTAEFTFEVST